MERTHFFDRLFPTRAISRIPAVVILISVIGLVITSAAFAASWETSSMRAPGLYTITFSGERVVKIVVTPNRD